MRRRLPKMRLRDYVNRRVRSLRTMRNGMFDFPAGTEFTVTGVGRNGLILTADACAACGIRPSISAVRPVEFDPMNGAVELAPPLVQFIWQMGLQAGQPNMLAGYPVEESEAMTNSAGLDATNGSAVTGDPVLLFGDLSQFWIVERLNAAPAAETADADAAAPPPLTSKP